MVPSTRSAPDARFPTAKARIGIAAAIGPLVSRLAGRVAKKNDLERVRPLVVGPLAKIIRPMLKSPTSSVLGPVDTAPYDAFMVEASALGTVGGPNTDARGRALNTEGSVIPGLYTAGNAGGTPTKGFYGGAGGTTSLGLVFGYLAGREQPGGRMTPVHLVGGVDHSETCCSTVRLGGQCETVR